MTSLTPRGRFAVVGAFVAASMLFAGAAVALVKASDHERSPGTALPTTQPTLVFPSGSPTATPTTAPSVAPTVAPSASASPSASATATRSPAASSPAVTSSPAAKAAHLTASATLSPSGGDTTTETVFVLTAHATDGKGKISFTSLDWGDGTQVDTATGTQCAHSAAGDCVNFSFSHTYDTPGNYPVSLVISSGPEQESVVLDNLTAKVKNYPPSPTPSP